VDRNNLSNDGFKRGTLGTAALVAAIRAAPGLLSETPGFEILLFFDAEDETRSAIGALDGFFLKTQNDLSLKVIILVGVRVSDVLRNIRGDSTQIARPKLELILNYSIDVWRYAK
jgi:hypothetical protein